VDILRSLFDKEFLCWCRDADATRWQIRLKLIIYGSLKWNKWISVQNMKAF